MCMRDIYMLSLTDSLKKQGLSFVYDLGVYTLTHLFITVALSKIKPIQSSIKDTLWKETPEAIETVCNSENFLRHWTRCL
jgi:hypothetical protein